MNFYIDVITKDDRFTSNARCNDVALLEPITRAAVAAILAASPEPLMVFETYRSQARQTMLFNQRATQLATVGVHRFGLAVDLVKVVNGQPSWQGDFTFLKALAEENGLIWGGDWGNSTAPHSFRDMDHVQRVTVKDQNRLFYDGWYPEEGYKPEYS